MLKNFLSAVFVLALSATQAHATSSPIIWGGADTAQSLVSQICFPDHSCITSGGGGITQLTGDVSAGPGAGTQAATVVSVGGKTAAQIATVVTNNTTDVTVDNVGNAPTDAGLAIVGQEITLEPSDSTHPGVLTAIAQDVGGVKNFTSLPTVVGTPTLATQLAPKGYVDTLLTTGSRFVAAVSAATVTTLPANTYSNGASGVGATLTANANGAFPTLDGVAAGTGQVYLVKSEATNANNGAYQLTTLGTGGTPWVLTRIVTYDQSSEISAGTFFNVLGGTTNQNTQWSQTTTGTITVGSSSLVFQELSAPTVYTASLGVKLNVLDFETDFLTNQGLALSGNSLKVDYDNSTLGIVSNKLAILDSGVTPGKIALANTHLLVGNVSGAAADVAMSGDTSITNLGALTVNTVGGSTAANIHTGEVLANAATDADIPSTIVRRDGSGHISLASLSVDNEADTGNLVVSGHAVINGNTDTAQLLVNANGTQTADLQEWFNSVLVAKVDHLGNISGLNLSGTNRGDVTIGTANGLSLSTQVLSLATATSSSAGAISRTGNLSEATSAVLTISGGTNSIIGTGTTIQVTKSDSTHDGYLAGPDWVTFNSKQAALTIGNLTDAGTDGISITGGTGAVIGSGAAISQHIADASHNGYLGAADWSVFSNTVSQTIPVHNSSGSTITFGAAITVNGFDAGSGRPTVILARADALATMPPGGLMAASCANGADCLMQVAGVISNFNSSLLSVGQAVYVSASTAGGLTTVQPSPPNIPEAVGFVKVVNASTGSLYLNFSQPDGIQGGSRSNTWLTGDGTAGAKTIGVNNGFTETISMNPSGNQILTAPDVTGTLATITGGNTQTFTNTNIFSGSITVNDNVFIIRDQTNTADQIQFRIDSSSSRVLTVASGLQTGNRVLSVPVLGGDDTLATLAVANTFTGVNTFTGQTKLVVADGTDSTKKMEFDPSGNSTGIVGTIKTQFTTAKTVTFPDTTTVLAGLGTAQSFTSTNNFLDGSNLSIFIRNTSDTSKRLDFDISGNTTGIDTTFKTQSTSGQSITFPFGSTTDTVVLNNGTLLINGAKSFNNFTFQDVTTASKKITLLDSAASASTTLTLAGNQSTSQTLNIPNITGTDTLVTAAFVQTLTGKRNSPRTTVTNAPGATPTVATDSNDFLGFTGLATAITSMTTNLTGTPTEAQKLWIAFTDNGTARAITWGTGYENGPATLPVTTVISTRLDVGFIWNTVTSKWRCVAAGP